MALLSNNSEFNYRIWLIPVQFCEMLPKMASETHTVKPQFNEPLYNEPQFNEPLYNEPQFNEPL